jgi:polyisoprenoid-binding protein YceI
MRRITLLMVIGPALGAVSCCATARPPVGPGAGAPAAGVAAAPAALRITPEDGKITFVGSTPKTSQSGGFSRFAGTLEMPGDEPTAARITLDVDMDSAWTYLFPLTWHLKSADFLDVAHYPRATFVSERVGLSQGPGATHVITGDLTLHGVTRPVAIPATFVLSPDAVTLTGTFKVRQSQFGMDHAAQLTNDEVPVTFALRVPRR